MNWDAVLGSHTVFLAYYITEKNAGFFVVNFVPFGTKQDYYDMKIYT